MLKQFLLVSYLMLVISFNTRAQTWQQIGPGAGGQLRALYEHPLPNNKFDLYVGSDVSGVWKASNLDRTSFDNTNTKYEYLSNHRIFRFVNKFVHSPLLSDKLFAVSRGGIDIIDLNGVLPMTQVAVELSGVAVDLSESWVSDMHIAPGNSTGEYKVWFITGNSQLYDNEKKSNSIDDIYYGTYYASTNNIVLDGSQNLPLLASDRNAYCIQWHDNNTAGNLSDDYLLIGTQNGLYQFDISNQTISAVSVAPIIGNANNIHVSSILLLDEDNNTNTDIKVFITVSEHGIYYTDAISSTSTWTSCISVLNGTGLTLGSNVSNVVSFAEAKRFTKLYVLKDSQNYPTGFIATTANNEVTVNNVTKYTGAYYTTANVNFLPETTWTGLYATINNNNNNDFGWNTSRPSANLNSSIMLSNTQLLMGKSGNLLQTYFLGNNIWPETNWKQLYTIASANSACPSQSNYNHIGYVNTATRTVMPDGNNNLWIGQLDRFIFNSKDGGQTFSETAKTTQATGCTGATISVGSSCNQNPNSPDPLSDCLFTQMLDGAAYAGFGRGFGQSKAEGYIAVFDGTNWVQVGNANCGDPQNCFKVNGFLYASFLIPKIGATIAHTLWYKLIGNIWTPITYFTLTSNFINSTEAVLIPHPSIANNLYLYAIQKSLQTTVLKRYLIDAGNICTLDINYNPTFTDAEPSVLAIMPLPYNTNHIICGLKPLLDANDIPELTNNLYDVTNVTPSVINGSAVCNQAQIFIALNSENIDNVDEGITAIYPYPETQSIYISTVDYTGTITSPKARLYRGSYDAVGAINSQGQCWQEITHNLPNKSFTYLNANDLNSTTNNHYLYACVRGLGAWKVPVAYCQTFENTIDPANTNTWPIPNQNYNLNTNLEIASGNSYTFDSNILSIAEGISITIKNGATLNIDNSTLYACGNMWQGIIIEDGGTLNVTNNTVISDAQNAVYVMPDGNLDISEATLDRNYIGINIPQLNSGLINITGTTFSCTGCTTNNPLKRSMSSNTGTVTRAGLILGDGIYFIGNTQSGTNIFKELYRGIEANNSTCKIVNATFENFPQQNEYIELPADPGGGIAIFASNNLTSTLSITGLGINTASPFTFTDCYQGVWAKSGHVTATQNKMHNMTYGITARENEWSNLNISANLLTNVRNTGVQCLLNETAFSISIIGNEITTVGSIAKAILISERGTAIQGRKLFVEANIITTTNGGSGIECNNVNHVRVLYNSITQAESSSNTNPQYGIKLNGNEATLLSCNGVTRSNNSAAANFGYHINLSTGNNMVCNTAHGNDVGIYFGGDCDVFNSVSGNTMTNCATGLLLNSAARLGTQLHRGNKWINTQGGITKAENLNSVNNNFLNSTFWFNSNSGTVYAPTIINPPLWFVPDVTGITFNGCASQVCNTAIAGGGNGDEEQLKSIARDSAISYDYMYENRNQAQQNLYAVLYQDSLLRASDSIFANFFGNHQSEAIGQLHEVGKSLACETVYDSLFKQTMNQADSFINIKTDSLLLTNNVLQRQWLINGIRLLQDSIQALLSQKQVAALTLNENAASINDVIIANEIPETNLKAINGMELLYNKYGTDTLIHFYSFIESIAQQCPYSGGKAVFRARIFLSLFNDSIVYNDADVCLQNGIYRNLIQQEVTTPLSLFDFSLLPNPVSQQVQVALNFTNESPIHFEIRNVLGGKVSEFVIDKGLQSIVFTTQNFDDGIYFIRVLSNGLSLMTKKLIIIKK